MITHELAFENNMSGISNNSSNFHFERGQQIVNNVFFSYFLYVSQEVSGVFWVESDPGFKKQFQSSSH